MNQDDLKLIVREGWVHNGRIRLHYIESNPKAGSALLPIFYIPGALGSAEGFRPEMEALAPRRCISVSLRGRGKSDVPGQGYSFNEHIGDIEALVHQLGLNRFCLMAWSVGVPYSIEFAADHREQVAGLVLLDYAAKYPRFSPQWAAGWSDPSSGFNPTVVHAIQRESAEILLWDRLDKITCPILVIGGGTSGTLLKPEDIEKYRHHLRDGEVVIFNDSGHNPSQPDFDRFIRTIKLFLQRMEARIHQPV